MTENYTSEKNLVLKTENLCFSYGRTKILKNVDFRAYEGQLVALIGPNGAGKSTLFKCMLKFLKGYEGNIFLDGKNMRDMTRPEIARRIAYIPQTTVPVFNYDVLDIVLMGMTGNLRPLESPGKEHVDKAMALLEDMEIAHLAHRGFGRISGGERQLVLLARALIQDARILVMDEPTANLDYGNQFKVMERIRNLVMQGYTVILSTHNPEHAMLFAEKSFVLKEGQVVAAGPSEDVMTAELMRDIYGVSVNLIPATFEGRKVNVCIPVSREKQK